jgi:plasmid stabilization system protein ParE
MSRRVTILALARADIDDLFQWIADRSPAGAERWYDALQATVKELSTDADSFPVASEFNRLNPAIRQAFFKTRRGNRYRIVFLIAETEVRILRVRGPGQRPLKSRDLPNAES